MIAVLGTFRFPPAKVEQARPLMARVTARTLQEPGCLAYAYSQDIGDPGLFHVTEKWTDRAALEQHFQTAHMAEWIAARAALGFHDRQISVYTLGTATRSSSHA
jgi:quinol monooxygenase YgiN